MILHPLGDQAVLAYLPDEATAVLVAARIRTASPPWLEDVVPAYASLGVFFDANTIDTAEVMRWLQDQEQTPLQMGLPQPAPPATFVIPVCYEMQLDLPRVCEQTGQSADEVIRLHTTTPFTVYAIGFVPGFPYLGYLPVELCGVPRLPSPRVRVEPGSVALTGRQTGIYPLPRPGGWNVIGRTPLVMVDVASGYFPLRVGDQVRFTRIDDTQYRELEGERLVNSPGG